MQNSEWVLNAETDFEKIYHIKSPTAQYIQVCSPEANRQINERFVELQRNLRVGFYWIKAINQQNKPTSEVNEVIAQISYKENLDRKFVDMGISIELQPLFSLASHCLNGEKFEIQKDPSILVGKSIYVQSSKVVDLTYNSGIAKDNQVLWAILNYPVTPESNFTDNFPEVVFYPEGWEPEVEELYPEGWEPDEEEPNPEGFDPPEADFYPEE